MHWGILGRPALGCRRSSLPADAAARWRSGQGACQAPFRCRPPARTRSAGGSARVFQGRSGLAPRRQRGFYAPLQPAGLWRHTHTAKLPRKVSRTGFPHRAGSKSPPGGRPWRSRSGKILLWTWFFRDFLNAFSLRRLDFDLVRVCFRDKSHCRGTACSGYLAVTNRPLPLEGLLRVCGRGCLSSTAPGMRP